MTLCFPNEIVSVRFRIGTQMDWEVQCLIDMLLTSWTDRGQQHGRPHPQKVQGATSKTDSLPDGVHIAEDTSTHTFENEVHTRSCQVLCLSCSGQGTGGSWLCCVCGANSANTQTSI